MAPETLQKQTNKKTLKVLIEPTQHEANTCIHLKLIAIMRKTNYNNNFIWLEVQQLSIV